MGGILGGIGASWRPSIGRFRASHHTAVAVAGRPGIFLKNSEKHQNTPFLGPLLASIRGEGFLGYFKVFLTIFLSLRGEKTRPAPFAKVVQHIAVRCDSPTPP